MRYIVGLANIGRHMGWSQTKVKRMILKYGFPVMRLPGNYRNGWAYHLNPERIPQWEREREVEARTHLAGTPSVQRWAIREAPPAPQAQPDTTRDCVLPQQDQALTQPNTTPDPGESDV